LFKKGIPFVQTVAPKEVARERVIIALNESEGYGLTKVPYLVHMIGCKLKQSLHSYISPLIRQTLCWLMINFWLDILIGMAASNITIS
jgi:hypothetical protein